MKYLKALLIVMITLFTFGSAMAQDSQRQRADQSGQHHYRHRRHHMSRRQSDDHLQTDDHRQGDGHH